MTMHLMITDKSGNNGVIEWVGGDMHFHKQQGRMVMTNDPSYEKMLAIRNYYREMGVENSMPGSALSQARFVYIDGWLKQLVNEPLPGYIGGIKDQNLDEQKLYSALSVIRGVSTPLGVAFDTSHPNNTSTIWRTMADLNNNKFYTISQQFFSRNTITVFLKISRLRIYFDMDVPPFIRDRVFLRFFAKTWYLL